MPGPIALHLVRHGAAEERGEAWPDDAKRPLTPDGAKRMKKAVRGLARIKVTLDVILTSPLLRARQTADILAAGLDPHPAVVVTEALGPGASYPALVAELEKHGRKSRVALVGHEPAIGELAARLIGSRHPVEFKKGAICRIDVDAIPPSGPGDLRWLVTTKMLRKMGK